MGVQRAAAAQPDQQVLAARDERDVVPGLRESAAEVAADAAGAEYRNLHSFTASRLTTGSSPMTAALWTVPRGISIQSPAVSTFM